MGCVLILLFGWGVASGAADGKNLSSDHPRGSSH